MPTKGRVRKAAPVRKAAAVGGPSGEIVLYRAPDGRVHLNVKLERETIWLNQKQMALLFDKDTDTIGLHIRNAFKEGELEEAATTEECSVVQKEGGRPVRQRIAAALFLWFLEKNGALYGSDRAPRVSDVALVALTLLIAESNPAEKETIVRLVTHLLHECPGEATP